MPNGMYNRETYLMGIPEGPERKRAAMTFDMLYDIHKCSLNQPKKCEPRFKKLERRKWLNKGISFTGGLIGGVLGFLGLKMS